MTVSAAAASNAAAQAIQAARIAAANANTRNSNASGSAFSAVANAANQLPGIAATGGSTLSANMLSALLGMNSPSSAPSTTPATPPGAPNTGATPASAHHHHGLGAYAENLLSTASSLVSAV